MKYIRRQAAPKLPVLKVWGPPQLCTVTGWAYEVKEPSVSKDGLRLYFNSNGGTSDPDSIHVATFVNNTTWAYSAPATALNTAEFNGAAEESNTGGIFYASTETVPTTWDTLFRSTVAITELSDDTTFEVDVDPSVVDDDDILYWARATLNSENPGQGFYVASNLRYATKSGGVYTRIVDDTFDNVNTTAAREYAPSISSDNRTLYWTREVFDDETVFKSRTEILEATRGSATGPFLNPKIVVSEHPLQEAPSIIDTRLYYHAVVNVGGTLITRLWLKERV